MKSEIIAVGSEMLTPFRQDTNSLAITGKLNGLGIGVAFKTVVGDRRKDLVGTIKTALGRVDAVVVMGGLGPTEDDLTREAVAEALQLTLRRDATQVAALHARAATWRIPMPANNLKQADVLEGATLLPNPNGSAPGQWLDTTYGGVLTPRSKMDSACSDGHHSVPCVKAFIAVFLVSSHSVGGAKPKALPPERKIPFYFFHQIDRVQCIGPKGSRRPSSDVNSSHRAVFGQNNRASLGIPSSRAWPTLTPSIAVIVSFPILSAFPIMLQQVSIDFFPRFPFRFQ